MSAAAEIEQLRKRLMHSQNIISELNDEIKEGESMRQRITAVGSPLEYANNLSRKEIGTEIRSWNLKTVSKEWMKSLRSRWLKQFRESVKTI